MRACYVRNIRGNVGITFAFAAVILAVCAGGAIDMTAAASDRAALQEALDAGVLAGAKTGDDTLAASYFRKNLNAPGVTVGTPSFSHPTDVTYRGMVSAQLPTSFLSLIGLRQISISVSSTATTSTDSGACILAMDPTMRKAVSVGGSGIVNSPNCDVVANSTDSDAVDTSGSSTVTANCLKAVGGVSATGTVTLKCGSPKGQVTAVADPYSSVPEPSIVGSCKSVPSGSSITLSAGYYCHGISIGSSTSATFQPGVYYIDGNLSFGASSSSNGSGVTMFVTAGHTTSVGGGANVSLSAPTSGTYSGIVFFGSRSGAAKSNNTFSGSSSSVLTGALYFPSQTVTYSGSAGQTTNCTQLIGDSISIGGNANFKSNCADFGLKPIGGTAQMVLVE